MFNLIVRLFIKNYGETENPDVRCKYGQVSGGVGIVTNMILVVIKALVGIASGSISIIADAANNLSDAGSSLITLVGFRLSRKPADTKHPYGHARIEYLTGLFTSVVMIILGVELCIKSINSIISGNETSYNAVTFIILGAAILVKVWQWLFYMSMSRRISSSALKASGLDARNDVLVTASVMFCAAFTHIFGNITLFGWKVSLDGISGLAVAVFILITGIKSAFETADPLLGNAPAPELISMISKRLLSTPGVLGIHDLAVHSYGAGATFVSVHVEVDCKNSIVESHGLADDIESYFRKAENITLVVHLDPVDTDDTKLSQMKIIIRDALDTISPKLSFHDLRAVYAPTHTNLIFDISVPSEVKIPDGEISRRTAEYINTYDPTIFAVITVEQPLCNLAQ